MCAAVAAFLKSAATCLDTSSGKVTVVLLAMNLIAWKLPSEVQTSKGCFLREVFWLDLDPLYLHGYHPRFGDHRDRRHGRTANYHEKVKVVIAQWRRRTAVDDLPGGVSDDHVRTVSEAKRRAATQ